VGALVGWIFGLGGSFGLVGALVGWTFGLAEGFRFGWEFWFDRSLALHRLGGSFTRSLVGVLELVM